MKHKMWYDDENQILFLEFVDDFRKDDVEKLYGNILKMLEGKSYRQMVVVMSKSHKVENRETRELTNDVLQKSNISEIAFVGGNAANRMIAKVLLKTGAIKTKGDFFKKREDAIEWLQNKR